MIFSFSTKITYCKSENFIVELLSQLLKAIYENKFHKMCFQTNNYYYLQRMTKPEKQFRYEALESLLWVFWWLQSKVVQIVTF